MSRQDVELITAQGGQFLSPASCGSTVQWHVRMHTWQNSKKKDIPQVNGTIKLSDCSRVIEWSASDYEDLNKIDRAIEELRKVKKALTRALSLYEDLGGDQANE